VASENIVALYDVNEANLDAAAARHPKARQFVDFRKLYDHAKEFDAVVVSTCEHTHAFATLPALQLGKQAKDIVCVQERPEGSQPVPEGLDWNLWGRPPPQERNADGPHPEPIAPEKSWMSLFSIAGPFGLPRVPSSHNDGGKCPENQKRASRRGDINIGG